MEEILPKNGSSWINFIFQKQETKKGIELRYLRDWNIVVSVDRARYFKSSCGCLKTSSEENSQSGLIEKMLGK